MKKKKQWICENAEHCNEELKCRHAIPHIWDKNKSHGCCKCTCNGRIIKCIPFVEKIKENKMYVCDNKFCDDKSRLKCEHSKPHKYNIKCGNYCEGHGVVKCIPYKTSKQWVCESVDKCNQTCLIKQPHPKKVITGYCKTVDGFVKDIPYVEKQANPDKLLTTEEISKMVPDLCDNCKHNSIFCAPRVVEILNMFLKKMAALLLMIGIKNCNLFLYVRECERFEAKDKEGGK